MCSILRSNKGSALLTVLVVIIIASILGIALTTLTAVNYRSVQASADILKTKYSAEAGLDQVYIVINDQIKQTLNDIMAHEEQLITEKVEAAIQYQWSLDSSQWTLLGYDINGNVIVNNTAVSEYTQNAIFRQLFLNGSLASEVDASGNRLVKGFLAGFGKYFPEIADNIDTDTRMVTRNVDINGSHLTQTVTIEDINELLATDSDILSMHLDVVSTVNIDKSSTGNAINKVISLRFEVPVPQYANIVEGGVDYTPLIYDELPKNVLWTKALAAGKDLKVESGGNLTVTGNLFVAGDMASANIGGVIADGEVTVNGNVSTRGYLLCNSPNSSITVNKNTSLVGNSNSEVFCNSIAIGKYSDGSKITINGNVDVSDDVELNGKGKIEIYGNFYGFQNEMDTSNKSSSILVNYDLEKNNDTDKEGILIKGAGVGKSYYPGDGSGTYIAGTAYVGVTEVEGLGDDEKNKYQTGESVAIRGNYLYYTNNSWYFGSYDESNPNKNKVSVDDEVVDLSKGNITFSLTDYEPALDLAIKINGISDFIKHPGGFINLKNSEGARYKAAYITAVANDPSKSMLLGNGKIDISNIKYSLGAYITKDADIDKFVMKNDMGSNQQYSEMSEAFNRNLQEYNYQVNRMGDPQITNWQSDDIQDTLQNPISISERFNFTTAAAEYNDPEENDHGQITYSGENPNEVLVIIGEGCALSEADINAEINSKYGVNGTFVNRMRSSDLSKLEGIIATKGSVYIAGNINYTGTIIAEGDIIIGPGTIGINNVYDDSQVGLTSNNYVISKVVGDLTLRTSFNAGGTQTYNCGYYKNAETYGDNTRLNPEKYYSDPHNKVTFSEWKVNK